MRAPPWPLDSLPIAARRAPELPQRGRALTLFRNREEVKRSPFRKHSGPSFRPSSRATRARRGLQTFVGVDDDAAAQLGGRPPEPLSSVVCVRGIVTGALVIGLALAAGAGCGSGESTGSAASASQSALTETATPSTTTLETSSTETVAGPQKSRPCPPFTIGPASFSEIRVAGIDCFEARQLLDQTMLAKVRKNRNAWTYGGWSWTFELQDETSGSIVGADGFRRIEAVFSVA